MLTSKIMHHSRQHTNMLSNSFSFKTPSLDSTSSPTAALFLWHHNYSEELCKFTPLSHYIFSLQTTPFRILETTLVKVTYNFHLTKSNVEFSYWTSLKLFPVLDTIITPSCFTWLSEDHTPQIVFPPSRFSGWYLLFFLTSEHSHSLDCIT